MSISESEKSIRQQAYEGNKTEQIYMHFHACNLQFTTEQLFSNEKRDAFMTIMDISMHMIALGEWFVNSDDLKTDVQTQIMKQLVYYLLICIVQQHPPRIEVQGKLSTEYIKNIQRT